MSFSRYEGPAKIQVNGRTIAEAVSSTLSMDGGRKPVLTMHKGLGGFAQGPIQGSVEMEQAVPKSGFDQDFLTLLQSGSEVEISIAAAGKRIIVPAVINTFELRNGVDTAAGVRTQWVCGPAVIR
jgi:hypothetical protein